MKWYATHIWSWAWAVLASLQYALNFLWLQNQALILVGTCHTVATYFKTSAKFQADLHLEIACANDCHSLLALRWELGSTISFEQIVHQSSA